MSADKKNNPPAGSSYSKKVAGDIKIPTNPQQVIGRIKIVLPNGNPLTISSVACGANDLIYVTGQSSGDFYVVALLSDGQIYTAFGEGGFARLSNPESEGPVGITSVRIIDVAPQYLTLQADVITDYYYMALYRLRINGTMAPTFGINGVVLFDQLPIGSMPTHEISVSGRRMASPKKVEEEIASLRRHAQRAINFSGEVAGNLSSFQTVAHRFENGKMLLIAYTGIASRRVFYLMKIHEDGSPDTAFANGSGFMELSASYATDFALAVDNQGRAIVAYDDTVWITIRCYQNDGDIDKTFGTEGKMEITYPWGYLLNPALKVDPQGYIYLGITYIDWSYEERAAVIAKITGKGYLDPNFNNNGSFFLNTKSSFHSVQDIEIDSQQRVVVRGTTDKPGGGFRGIVSRCTSSGMDNSFGDAGNIILDGFTLTSLAVQGDLAIVVAGTTNGGDSEIWRLAS